jgi:calpain-15
MAALAEWPERVKKIFKEDAISPNGAYSVRLHYLGIPTTIVVDDSAPCEYWWPFPIVVSKSKDSEIWITILEKAVAKMHGSYGSIEAGLPSYGLSILTGAPSIDYLHSSTDDLIAKMKEAESLHWVMVTGTNENAAGNLATSHAYSSLAIIDIQSRGKPVTLVKIRNPWGTELWDGDWSDESHLWTPELM